MSSTPILPAQPAPPSHGRRWWFAIAAVLIAAGPCLSLAGDITANPASCPPLQYPLGTPPLVWAVDTEQRHLARAFFNAVYWGQEDVAAEWTGQLSSCLPGTTSTALKESVRERINYFRAMAGVPATITLDATKNAQAQQSALIMAAQGALSHTPPTQWACFNATGAAAAGKSNLSLGHFGASAVTGQLRDNGSNNARVGHRRWLLYPQTQTMGTGDVPPGVGTQAANAVYLIDDQALPRPATRDDFVAWPPPGFVPWQVVWPRWSLSYPQADFTAATVTMTRDGASLAVTKETVYPPAGATFFIGENTLVWIPSGADPENDDVWPRPGADETYRVVIDNVQVNGSPRRFDYTVVIFDPARPATGEALAQVQGPAQVVAGLPTAYTINAVTGARAFYWRTTTLGGSPAPLTAELDPSTGNVIGVIDGTSSAYPLSFADTDTGAFGNRRFHLTHPEADPRTQWFELADALLPGPGSSLQFDAKLAWASSDQRAVVQISLDDGHNWQEVYSQTGTGAGDTTYTQRRVNLGAYAGRIVRLRFLYAFTTGSYYPQTKPGVGFHLDNIVITDARVAQPGCPAITDSTGHFTLTARSTGTLLVQASPVFAGNPGPGDWGALLSVLVNNTPTDDDGDGVANVTDNCPSVSNPVQTDTDRDGRGDDCPFCTLCMPERRGWRTGIGR